MGKRTLVASGETGSTVSASGSTVKFPASGNLWADRPPKADNDIRVMASLSASSNYTVQLVASFQDPDTSSVFNGVVEHFAPGDTLGDGAGAEVFRSSGKHVHHEWLEITNSCTASDGDMTVEQLAVVWESA